MALLWLTTKDPITWKTSLAQLCTGLTLEALNLIMKDLMMEKNDAGVYAIQPRLKRMQTRRDKGKSAIGRYLFGVGRVFNSPPSSLRAPHPT